MKFCIDKMAKTSENQKFLMWGWRGMYQEEEEFGGLLKRSSLCSGTVGKTV